MMNSCTRMINTDYHKITQTEASKFTEALGAYESSISSKKTDGTEVSSKKKSQSNLEELANYLVTFKWENKNYFKFVKIYAIQR